MCMRLKVNPKGTIGIPVFFSAKKKQTKQNKTKQNKKNKNKNKNKTKNKTKQNKNQTGNLSIIDLK